MEWASPIVVVAVSVEPVVVMSVVLTVVSAAVGRILPWAFQRIPLEETQHP